MNVILENNNNKTSTWRNKNKKAIEKKKKIKSRGETKSLGEEKLPK